MRLHQNLILAVVILWGTTHVIADSSVDPDGVSASIPNAGTILPREDKVYSENDFPLELPHRDVVPAIDEEEELYGIQSNVEVDFFDSDVRQISVTDLLERSRKLSLVSSTIGTFHPLECNINLASAPCTTNVSANLPSNNNPLLVKCGECYVWDMNDSTYTLVGGINIKGKLLFPTNKKVTIRTPYVIVQGEVSITSDDNIKLPIERISRIVTFNLNL